MNVEARTQNATKAATLAICLALSSACGCATGSPLDADVFDAELAPCPSSPNCVSSRADDGRHRIEPIVLTSDDTSVWQHVADVVRADPKSRVVFESDYYLIAEYRSTVFAFVDDLELLVREDRKTVDVRSASRLGYWDWGVNRARVEALRAALRKKGLAQ